MADNIKAQIKLAVAAFRLDVDLTLPGTGISCIYGPSGSGKTTVLRCIAGLERDCQGKVSVKGETWQQGAQFLPTYRRALGYVFQEPSLFPHLTVGDNVAYGLRRAAARANRSSLERAIELLGIRELLGRRPHTLSGGERQRAAIARAIAANPKLLLMDEPLAALDNKRKSDILPYLEQLHAQLDMPILYVTHSLDEVARLADYLVVMDNGQAVASGPLAETFSQLDISPSPGEDAGVVLETTVSEHSNDGLTTLRFSGGQIRVPRRGLAVGNVQRLRIDARDVSLALSRHEDSSILNILAATVTELNRTEHQVLVGLRCGETRLLARITPHSCDRLGITPGQNLFAQIKSAAFLS